MKNLFLTLIFFITISSIYAQQNNNAYNFPVKPGTDEWKKFQSRSEMADVLQVPSAILKNLTTEALAKTCMNFPMFKDLYFFNSVQTGFNTLKQSFNGFEELIRRGDAGLELFKLYKQMNPTIFNSTWNDTLKGSFAFQFVQIEMLLAQNEIINTLTEESKTALLKEAAQKYELKKASNQFSGFTLSPSILILGRILDKESKLQNLKGQVTNGSIQRFLLSGTAENSEILEQIWLVSKN